MWQLNSQMWEKKSLNVIKIWLHVMLVLPNVTMKPSNVSKKYETTKFDRSTIKCNVGTT